MIGPEKPSRPPSAETASRPPSAETASRPPSAETANRAAESGPSPNGPPTTERSSPLPEGLLGMLERFVSPVSASSMLRAAVAKAERATGTPNLVAVLQQLELSATILILPSKRDEALAAIRAMMPGTRSSIEPDRDEPTVEESVVVVRKESDLNYTRMLAREACNLVGVRGYSAQKLVTAVSELARNIARYVGDGKIRFRIDTDAQRIIVIAEDHGPGIANLEDVLNGSYRSKTGLGRGLMGVRNLADEFEIETGPGGTLVKIAFRYT
jgi:serine/threonine-protein kinase RsbT